MPRLHKKIGPKAIHLLDMNDQHVRKACYKLMHKAVQQMVTQAILSQQRRALYDTATGTLICEFKDGQLEIHAPRKFRTMMCEHFARLK